MPQENCCQARRRISRRLASQHDLKLHGRSTRLPGQLAQIALSTNDRLSSTLEDGDLVDGASTRTGPMTVFNRAVMEHNVLESSRIYNNISFSGLGALLDLTPGAAETMAHKMIEQGRLKEHIDQVDKLIWFEAAREENDAQGKASGLGDVNQDMEDTGSLFTKRWDQQIRMTAAHVETLVQHLAQVLSPWCPVLSTCWTSNTTLATSRPMSI
ncbi:hypothetical protein F5888DRAFT_1928018 [Russula emetica]|nr:hypothetical protein F5888DRAFT_1935302 [Russula emetica]KAF8492201.1 hypothetical protein F5888DRAFT_1928018 [Russula emetica]